MIHQSQRALCPIEPLWLVEKKAIEAAIEHCEGQINHAAQLLQIAPSTIYRKLASWKQAEPLE